MKPATLGIQFCGGCNPRIDRGRIALELSRPSRAWVTAWSTTTPMPIS